MISLRMYFTFFVQARLRLVYGVMYVLPVGFTAVRRPAGGGSASTTEEEEVEVDYELVKM